MLRLLVRPIGLKPSLSERFSHHVDAARHVVGEVHLHAAESLRAKCELLAGLLIDLVPGNVVERIPAPLALGLLKEGRVLLVHPYRESGFHHDRSMRRPTTSSRSFTVTSSTRSSSGIMM